MSLCVSSQTGEAGASAPVSPPFPKLWVFTTVWWKERNWLVQVRFDESGKAWEIKSVFDADAPMDLAGNIAIQCEALSVLFDVYGGFGLTWDSLPAQLLALGHEREGFMVRLAETVARLENDGASSVREAYTALANRVRGGAA